VLIGFLPLYIVTTVCTQGNLEMVLKKIQVLRGGQRIFKGHFAMDESPLTVRNVENIWDSLCTFLDPFRFELTI